MHSLSFKLNFTGRQLFMHLHKRHHGSSRWSLHSNIQMAFQSMESNHC